MDDSAQRETAIVPFAQDGLVRYRAVHDQTRVTLTENEDSATLAYCSKGTVVAIMEDVLSDGKQRARIKMPFGCEGWISLVSSDIAQPLSIEDNLGFSAGEFVKAICDITVKGTCKYLARANDLGVVLGPSRSDCRRIRVAFARDGMQTPVGVLPNLIRPTSRVKIESRRSSQKEVEGTHLQEKSQARFEESFAVGDRVQMKDEGDSAWSDGVVSSTLPLKVRFTSAASDDDGYEWDEIRYKVAETYNVAAENADDFAAGETRAAVGKATADAVIVGDSSLADNKAAAGANAAADVRKKVASAPLEKKAPAAVGANAEADVRKKAASAPLEKKATKKRKALTEEQKNARNDKRRLAYAKANPCGKILSRRAAVAQSADGDDDA